MLFSGNVEGSLYKILMQFNSSIGINIEVENVALDSGIGLLFPNIDWDVLHAQNAAL